MDAQLIYDAVDRYTWRSVPGRVVSLLKQASSLASKVKDATKDLPAMPGYGHVYWSPEKKELLVSLGDSDEKPTYDAWTAALKGLPGVKSVRCEAEYHPKDYIKVSATQQSMTWLGRPHLATQSLLGGPNPATATIVSGLLGAGLGWGAGHIAEAVLPSKYIRKGPARSSLALLGGALGAAMPAARGAAAMSIHGPMGLFKQDADPVSFSKLSKAEKAAAMYAADSLGTGVTGAETIPVDAFNNAVWLDVRPNAAMNNPYGTKSPWGNNEQRLFSPISAPHAAVASGLVSGIGSALDKDYLSPMDIARGLVGAGVGGAVAKAFAGVAGAFFGVNPETQSRLVDMGALGGFLSPIVGKMFR